jgi:hypothetical protein
MANINIEQVAKEFTDLLNEWHSLPEVYDNPLDAQIHRWYADVKSVFPKKPYFSPSSANACPRELYMKQIGAKKDVQSDPPHKGRWRRIGTAIGDVIQRDLLFIEKHYEKQTGKPCKFRFERDQIGRPMFEDFAKTNAEVNHRGHKFHLFGTPDGIMQYVTEDGEVVRIGLEIKSKQTSAATTSLYSMREANPSHIAQTIGYSEMYKVDYYIVLYVNAAKKSWDIDDVDFEKTPDIRAFGLEFTQTDRDNLFDNLTRVLDAVNAKTPPSMDLWKWTFNNFKTACAKSLSDEEFSILQAQINRAYKSGIKDKKKQELSDALEFMREVREAK